MLMYLAHDHVDVRGRTKYRGAFIARYKLFGRWGQELFDESYCGGPYYIGPTVHTKTYITCYFYSRYLVLFTITPRNGR